MRRARSSSGTAPSSNSLRSLDARLTTSEWIVTLSGSSAFICARVSAKSSGVSPGSPMIRSMLILSKPHSLASANTCFVCATVCCLPMLCSVLSCIVCGFTEILSTPKRLSAISFSLVMLSGLPASTVISYASCTGKFSYRQISNSSSCSADNVVGVPPPIYTEVSFFPFCSSPQKRISLFSASR